MRKREMENVNDRDIVVYALYLLGGWWHRVHTEDIALKCYQIAPSKFSWVKYPKYPDLSPTRFALETAKRQRYGTLVKGESERKRTIKNIGGWMLTAEGIKWIKVNKLRIEQYLGKHRPTGERLRTDRKIKELFESAAFKKFRDYAEQAEISHAEFTESLVCTVNARPEILKDRLEQLYSIAEKLGRKEIKDYVDFCRRKFGFLLEEKESGENGKS
jgi:hypothetical protein